MSINISKKYKRELTTIIDGLSVELPTVETVNESKWIPYKDDKNPPQEMPEEEATDANGKSINMDHLLDI